MPKKDLIHYFIHKALTDSKTDLLAYKNPKFACDVRSVAMDAIIAILLKINSEHLVATARGQSFSLFDAINTPHPQTGLKILDYCLAAGFHELALRLFYNGADSNNLENFERNIDNAYAHDDVSTHDNANNVIIDDISEAFKKLHVVKKRSDLDLKSDKNNDGVIAALRNLCKEHPYPAILFGLGITCTIVAPIIHGTAAQVLLSVAVPSFLSSISSMQSSKGGKERKQDTHERDRISNEAKEIKQLIDFAKRLKRDMRHNFKAKRRSSEPNFNELLSPSLDEKNMTYSFDYSGTILVNVSIKDNDNFKARKLFV